MRIAICDDSLLDRNHYKRFTELLVARRGFVGEVCDFSSVEKLLYALNHRDYKKTPFDIIILDIMMRGVNGISVGKKLRADNYDSQIIYLTESSDFAIDAFDVGAVNYVVKEHDRQENGAPYEHAFLKALANYERANRDCVLINGIVESRNIPIEDIWYFSVDNHVCLVHYGAQQLMEFASTLARIELAMEPYGFVRTHRSYLVRGACIDSFTSKKVTLKNKETVPVGRNQKNAVKAFMEKRAVLSLDAEKAAPASKKN